MLTPARILAALLLIVGVWYASFGLALLLNLPQVTHNWIAASGDPDFQLDFQMFQMLGGALAVLAAGLGMLSVRAAVGTIMGDDAPRRHWLSLFFLAVLVHLFRGSAEMISGTLTRSRIASFVLVCIVYALLWELDRPAPRRHPAS